jgi:hypothetical protein
MSSSATFDFPSYMTQEEGNKRLFQAVLSGKVDTVREVLSYGFSNINATVPAPIPPQTWSSSRAFSRSCHVSCFVLLR